MSIKILYLPKNFIPPQNIFLATPLSRSRGRQRRRWTDDISEWSGMTINDAARVVEDRAEWREILRAANPSYGGLH